MTILSTGVATSFIDFTRASNATVTDSDGKVKWAPHNLLLASESFDAAAWSKTSVTPTANSIAAPNGTTTADTLAASGANGTTLQTFTAEAISYTFSVWLRRKTGTGTIEIAADSGTYTAVTITSSWALYTVTQTPAAGSKSAGIRIVTSGDEIYAWGAHLYRSDLAMQPNTSAYPMYNPTTVKNALGYTEDFGNAAWGGVNLLAFGSGSTLNAAGAPNGINTADKIVESTAAGIHSISQTVTTTASVRTFSVYLKRAERSFAMLYHGVSNAGIAINLDTGATNTPVGIAAPVSSSATPVGDGWYRCSISVNATAAGNTFGIYPMPNSSSYSYTGDGVSGIYLWGAQLSDSASLDSYSPVYGAAVTSAAYYGPRRDFDPVTLACKGLLVEEQRTNLIRYSRTLETTGSYWGSIASGTATAVTIDNAPGPDGLSTSASMITYNTAVTGGGTYSLWRQAVSGAANSAYTFSIWLKAGTTSSVYLRFGDNAGNRANTLCTLTSSWQRFTVTGTTAAGITTVAVDVGADGNTGGQTLTAGTVYAYGAQLELGGFATSYVPNGSAVAGATRNADVASVSTQAFPYSSTEGTLVAFASSALLPSAYTNGRVACLNDATSSNVIELYISQNAADTVNAAGRVMLGGVQQTNPTKVITNNADPHKIALAYKASDFAVTGDGLTPTPTASGAVPSAITRMQLGALLGGNYVNGHIRQITYIPRRLSNAELQTRTS